MNELNGRRGKVSRKRWAIRQLGEEESSGKYGERKQLNCRSRLMSGREMWMQWFVTLVSAFRSR